MRRHFISSITIAVWLGLASIGHMLPFDVALNAHQEVPTPTLDGATPTDRKAASVNTIRGKVDVDGTYQGTTSDVATAQLHGPSPSGVASPVIFGFTGSAGGPGGTADETTRVNYPGTTPGVRISGATPPDFA